MTSGPVHWPVAVYLIFFMRKLKECKVFLLNSFLQAILVCFVEDTSVMDVNKFYFVSIKEAIDLLKKNLNFFSLI